MMKTLNKKKKETLVTLGILPSCEYKADMRGLWDLMPEKVADPVSGGVYAFCMGKDFVAYHGLIKVLTTEDTSILDCFYQIMIYLHQHKMWI